MKVIRRNTFETNSSSCHSITLFNNAQDWQDFKEHKTYINREMYNIEEHLSSFDVIDEKNHDDYIGSIQDLYNDVKERFDNVSKDSLRSYRYSNGYDEKDDFMFNYLKKNFNEKLFIKIITGKGDEEIVKPEKPIVVRYDRDHTFEYDNLTVSDFYNYMFGYGCFIDDMPKFYIYGDDGDWHNATVNEYVEKQTNKEIVMVTRDQEC